VAILLILFFTIKKQTDKEIFIMDAGWLSILPPMIAIILALITKEVLFSLIAGVLSGTIIYSIASGMNPIVGPVSTVFDVMIQKADMNIIIFCFLLGGLV
jgi:tetracycline resistance efflux pump